MHVVTRGHFCATWTLEFDICAAIYVDRDANVKLVSQRPKPFASQRMAREAKKAGGAGRLESST
jgi:hypothetical protein